MSCGTATTSKKGRKLRALVLMALFATPNGGASARDGDGPISFFSQIFGGSGAAPTAPAPSDGGTPVSIPSVRHHAASAGRPLTVRMHRPKFVAAPGPVKPEKVSIYEDRTLRRGDAVMTVKGIRIFAGSNSWPYRPDDFVDLAEARRLDSRVEKVLADLDRTIRN